MKKLLFMLLAVFTLAACNEDATTETDTDLDSYERTGTATGMSYENAQNEIVSIENRIDAELQGVQDDDAREKLTEAKEKLQEAKEKLGEAEEKMQKNKPEEAQEKVEEAMEKAREAEEKAAEARQ